MTDLFSAASTTTVGPRFLDGVVWLGVAAAIVTAIGAALLIGYAIAVGILGLWHR